MNTTDQDSFNSSEKPAKLLAKHIDTIVYAIRHNKAIIESTVDNQKLINDLTRANLGSYVQDYQGLLLHTTVLRFVRFHESRGRALISGSQLGISIDDIYKAVETYRLAYQERLHDDDKNLVKQELFEAMSYFSSILIDLAHKFSVQVYDDLERYSHLKMRLYKGEQALKELSSINDILAGLNTSTLLDIGLQDAQIDEYLSILLVPAKNHCMMVLIDSAHKLNSTLLKIRQDLQNQHTSALIHGFLRLYKQNPNYLPDTAMLAENVNIFLKAHQPIQAYMDLDDIDSREVWQDIIAKLPLTSQSDNPTPPTEQVTAVIAHIEDKTSFLFDAVESVFNAVNQPSSQFVASELYNNLADELAIENVDLATWLLALAKFYEDHESEYPDVQLEFYEHIHPHYTGNRIVSDLLIKYVGIEQAEIAS